MAAERPGSESVSESAVEDFGDRAAGCLVGLAVGDALGVPREGAPPGEAVTEMEAVGGLPSGTWSDDTAQALAIAESLIDRGRFDPDDVAARLVEWYGSGGPGIGRTTLMTLQSIAAGRGWAEASRATHEALGGMSAGNAAIMRCAPVAIAFASDEAALIEASVASARITHWDPLAGEAAAALDLVIAGALTGEADPAGAVAEAAVICDRRAEGVHPRERLTSPHARVAEALREAVSSGPGDLDPASAFCLETLKTAAYFFMGAEDFEGALSSCVGLGGDADTNGAVLGAMLGARFGLGAIPARWRSALREEARILAAAAGLVGGYGGARRGRES